MAIRMGDIRRGVSLAMKSTNKQLKKVRTVVCQAMQHHAIYQNLQYSLIPVHATSCSISKLLTFSYASSRNTMQYIKTCNILLYQLTQRHAIYQSFQHSPMSAHATPCNISKLAIFSYTSSHNVMQYIKASNILLCQLTQHHAIYRNLQYSLIPVHATLCNISSLATFSYTSSHKKKQYIKLDIHSHTILYHP